MENRCMLAGDVSAIAGDSNFDGKFDSTDFVTVFAEGKFETGQAATFAQGDWNHDGYFNTSDFTHVFQAGTYEQAIAQQVDDGANVGEGDGNEDDAGRERKGRHRHGHHRAGHGHGGHENSGDRLARLIERLTVGIESGELPGNMTAEEAQAIIDGLNAAVEAEDKDAVKELLGQVHAARQLDRTQAAIDRLQGAVDAAKEAGEDSVRGLPIADVEAALASANEALAAGDPDAAKDALASLREARQADRQARRIQSIIDRVQTAVDAAKEAGKDSLGNRPLAEVEKILVAASEALEAGDVDAAKEALAGLRPDRDRPGRGKGRGWHGPGRDRDNGGKDDGEVVDEGNDNEVAGDVGRPDRGGRPGRNGGRGVRGPRG